MISTSLPFFPSLHLKTPFPRRCTLNPSIINYHDFNYTAAVGGGAPCSGIQSKKWVILSNDQRVVEAPTSADSLLDSASMVVKKFYQGINSHDLGSVENLIAENCVYEDLIFPQPFVGREAILKFFKLFNDSISTDLQFVIDDISEDDPSAVGVTWHLEWSGKPFPFSRGVSFYRLEINNGRRQIRYGRDSVEPAFKPGESALVVIKGVIWLLHRFPKLTDLL